MDSLHNTGEVSSRPDEVQDDVRMPSLIQPEVASVVPCQRNAAAATSLLTFCKRIYLLPSRAGNRRPVIIQHLEDSHGIKSLGQPQAGGEGTMVPRPSYCTILIIIFCSCYSSNMS